MRVDPTYLLLCGTLEHGVHETAEHDQQLLLVDIAQPQCGSAELECMYVCMRAHTHTYIHTHYGLTGTTSYLRCFRKLHCPLHC